MSSKTAALQNLFGQKKRKSANRSLWGTALIFTFLLLMGAFMILPFVYSIVNSFKPMDELFIFPPQFFVRRPTTLNYTLLFKLTANLWVPFSRYIFNSLFISIFTTGVYVILSSMAAYPLAKYKLKVAWLYKIVEGALLFNGTVLWLPQYVISAKMGLINTYFAYIIPALAAPLGLFLMKQFMEQVPMAIIESAQADGAKQVTVLFRIIMPMVKPAWLTLIVFCFQGIWNQQPFNLVFNEELKMINMAISQIVSGGISRMGVSMASGVVVMIPPLIVFLVSQSSIIETMAHSGIKE